MWQYLRASTACSPQAKDVAGRVCVGPWVCARMCVSVYVTKALLSNLQQSTRTRSINCTERTSVCLATPDQPSCQQRQSTGDTSDTQVQGNTTADMLQANAVRYPSRIDIECRTVFKHAAHNKHPCGARQLASAPGAHSC